MQGSCPKPGHQPRRRMRGRPSIGTSARPIDPPHPVGRTPTQEPSLQPPVPQDPKFRTLPRSVGLLSSPIFILDCSDEAPSLLTTTLRPRLRWKVPVSIQRLGTWMSCGLPPTDSGGWGRSAWVWDKDLNHSIPSPLQRWSSLCHRTNKTVMLLFLHQDPAES